MGQKIAEKIVDAIHTALLGTENDQLPDGVDIICGLPVVMDGDIKKKENEISIFLYDVHEDLSSRHGEVRHYEAGEKRFTAGSVRLNYCFLITYWGPEVEAVNPKGLKGVALGSADFIVRRLINLRELSDVAGSYCRVLPPSEGLSSLGSFWQALGNRPRLCLGYTVTAPMRLESADRGEIGMVRPF